MTDRTYNNARLIALLVDALRPFVEALGDDSTGRRNDTDIWETSEAAQISYGDLRKAAKALEAVEK